MNTTFSNPLHKSVEFLRGQPFPLVATTETEKAWAVVKKSLASYNTGYHNDNVLDIIKPDDACWLTQMALIDPVKNYAPMMQYFKQDSVQSKLPLEWIASVIDDLTDTSMRDLGVVLGFYHNSGFSFDAKRFKSDEEFERHLSRIKIVKRFRQKEGISGSTCYAVVGQMLEQSAGFMYNTAPNSPLYPKTKDLFPSPLGIYPKSLTEIIVAKIVEAAGHLLSRNNPEHLKNIVKHGAVAAGIDEQIVWVKVMNSMRTLFNSSYPNVHYATYMGIHDTHPHLFKPSDLRKGILHYTREHGSALLPIWQAMEHDYQQSLLTSLVGKDSHLLEKLSLFVDDQQIVQAFATFFDSKMKNTPRCRALWQRHVLTDHIQTNTELKSNKNTRKM